MHSSHETMLLQRFITFRCNCHSPFWEGKQFVAAVLKLFYKKISDTVQLLLTADDDRSLAMLLLLLLTAASALTPTVDAQDH